MLFQAIFSLTRGIARVQQWTGFNQYKLWLPWHSFTTKSFVFSSTWAFNLFEFSKSFKEIRNQRWLTIPRRWASKLVRPRAKLRSAYEFCLFLPFYLWMFMHDIFLFQYMIRYGFCLFQEKASTLMDRAGNAAQSAKESVQEVQIFSFSLIFYVFFREFILATTIACAQEYNEQMYNLITILVLGVGWSTGDVYGTGSCWRSEECNWNEQMN